MDPKLLVKLNKAKANRTPCVVVTELASGRDRLVTDPTNVPGELGIEIANAMRSGKSSMFTHRDTEYFLAAHVPAVRILICGAVHIAQPLTAFAHAANFEPIVIDPRQAFATEERFPNTQVLQSWPEEADVAFDRYTAACALSHDPKIDDPFLRKAIASECFYVGALGSRKSHAKRIARLEEAGAERVDIQRVSAPIGLDIGGATPAEIAISIIAEIVLARRGEKNLA
ncbi:MAG: XdhC family protein [Pseudomonadota bacterium]